MKIYRKAILASGFKASAVSCGIKKPGKLDLGLVYSDFPAKAACQFTANKIPAAPVKLNKKHLKAGKNFQAVIVNSGNANAFTGNAGLKDADETAKVVAQSLGLKKESVLVNSTGIIGKRLPLAKIKKAVPSLIKGLSAAGIHKVKKAIMTTDTFSKEITVKLNINGRQVTICGIAKGAGMIAPNMACAERSRSATLLCFIFTDADITPRALQKALRICVDNSFNCITVDGCMSTNDSVIVLANGAAGNALIDIDPVRNIAKIKSGSMVSNGADKNFGIFVKALGFVCLELAKLIVKDAEGATKFIQIKVKGAKNLKEAKIGALSIANSNLFKAAMYGENPNFGRIISALGASGINVKEELLKIKVSPLNKKEVNVEVALGRGAANATVYTSDLTPEYIKINAEYN